MSNTFLRAQFGRNGEAHRAPQPPSASESLPGDDDESLDTYIKVFVENGLKLQDELMVNHEAIAAARREYVERFQRKRQLGR